ncbi:MAG: DUF1571 domain-containing protein [Planctomycetes bacterium]|nr:DUF1571 domain-containing protein [Planctomycetota bacterium]
MSLLLITMLCAQYKLNAGPDAPVVLNEPVVTVTKADSGDPFEALIRRDPLAALRMARAEHLQGVTDYVCVMVKQELLPDGMSKEQEIKVKFRHEPYSVYMEWQRNQDQAARVIYVKGRWTDSTAEDPNDRELAVAQPGIIARIFVKSVKKPIHGALAKKASRRCIDDFGFQKTFDRLISVSELAQRNGDLTLAFHGETQFDDRPAWVLRRRLPYDGEGGTYPDRVAEILIDKEYRVPVAIYCFSEIDRHPRNLIAKYEYRSIRMQVGLTEKDFEPRTYGM